MTIDLPTGTRHNWLITHQQRLSEQMQKQQLPHAILMVGADGCGKSELAHWLINLFSCVTPVNNGNSVSACGQCKHCLLIKSHTYPDLKVIDEQEATIGVERLRDATHFLELKAQIGSNKAVLIANAESMSVAASNALLKTLEEPTAGSLLVLTTRNIEHLLPTIISRCQLVEIRPNLQQASSSYFLEKEPFANVSFLAEINDPELYKAYRSFAEKFLTMLVEHNGWQQFEQALLNEARSLVWLERIVSMLIRHEYGGDIKQSLPSELVQQVKKTLNIDSLNEIFQLILSTNKQLKDLPQINLAMAKQQLAISLYNYCANLEGVNG